MTVKNRVSEELRDLSEKCDKLLQFADSPEFMKLKHNHRDLLKRQLTCMLDYKGILTNRLELFIEEEME